MQILRGSRRGRMGAILLVVALAVASALIGASASSAGGPASGPQTHPITVQPDFSTPQRLVPGAVHFGCQDRPIDGSKGPRCYIPSQIQTAYGYSGLLASGVTGFGRTIVIIDAYSNPYVKKDLKIQDQTFGLPDPPSFTEVAPQGVPKFDANDPNQVGWAEEITLDVLWAHAMAPGARIILDEAKSNQDLDILNATQYAIDNNIGDVISQSFGEAESCVDPSILSQENALFAKATANGMTIFASSGDSGASQFSCDGSSAILAASSPASDPNVTGVGGTTLNASSPDGAYIGETAWTEQLFGCNPPAVDPSDINCSGGGFSTIYARPSWQVGNPNAGRGVPDVAYDAGVNGGVITHCGICNVLFGLKPSDPVFFIFGGTSAGSPQWAGLAADADQMASGSPSVRIGNINAALYQYSTHQAKYGNVFHDILSGNNDVAELGGQGYNAGNGWDAVTGLGTPDASRLLPNLAKLGS